MTNKLKFGPLKTATKTNLAKLPEKPGVYGLYNDQKLQYVGKVQRARIDERIKEHQNDGDIPFNQFGFRSTKTKDEATRVEAKLISSRKPPYNKVGK